MVHLNELKEKYGEKGLVVVAASAEGKSSVEDFIKEFEVKYPTITAKIASLEPFRSGGVPHAHLINSDGRILWSGHPGELPDTKIDEALDSTKILPEWPDALKAVRKDFLKDKYADALTKVAAEIGRGNLSEEDKTAAEAIQAWLEWYGTATLEGATKDVEGGRYYEAALAYELLTDLYKKHEFATKAADALKDLLSDADRKLEVTAGEKLAKILKEIADEKPKKALQKLKPLLGKKYAETAAGKRASELAAELEKAAD